MNSIPSQQHCAVAGCKPLSLKMPARKGAVMLPEHLVSIAEQTVESDHTIFVLLQDNKIQFSPKLPTLVFCNAPINDFIATRNYHHDLSSLSISVNNEQLWVNVGLYQLKFSLPSFHYVGLELADQDLAQQAPPYQAIVSKIVDYTADQSRADHKRFHFKYLLNLLANQFYSAARLYAENLLKDEEFIKARFFSSNAKILANELLAATNFYSFKLVNVQEIRDEAWLFRKIPFLDFPKKNTIRPSETKLFTTLVMEVIALSQAKKNVIPKIQQWFNLFMHRQEWIAEDAASKQAGQIVHAKTYGSFDGGTYAELYQRLYQSIPPCKKSEFVQALKTTLHNSKYDITTLCKHDFIVATQGSFDIDNYAARLGSHIENIMCAF